MVVRGDGERLDTGVDQELGENTLDLGLTRLEVITTDERLVLFGELDAAGNKSVLWGTIDERRTFEDTGNGEQGRRGHLVVGRLDCLEQVLGSVVDTWKDLGVSLSVGGPEDDQVVEIILRLEVADVGPEFLEVLLLVVTGNEVVGSVCLVGGDEVGVCVCSVWLSDMSTTPQTHSRYLASA